MRKWFVIYLLLLFVFYSSAITVNSAIKIEDLNKEKVRIEKEIKIKTDSLKAVKSMIAIIQNNVILNKYASEGKLQIPAKVKESGKITKEYVSYSETIGEVEKGEEIILLDYEHPNWYIKKDSILGYISRWYIYDSPVVTKFKEKCIKASEDKEKIELVKEKRELIKKYGEEVADNLLNGYYWVGMTDEMAKISLGYPSDINKTVGSWGVHEQWIYRENSNMFYLYFENGKLKSYQN